jgi:4-hydroxymandelate synthase
MPIDELIAWSSIGGEIDPELDNVCTDEEAADYAAHVDVPSGDPESFWMVEPHQARYLTGRRMRPSLEATSEFYGVDHVELYVGDARQSAFYLCTTFGFTICGQGGPETGLVDQRSLLLRQGDIQIVLTSGLVPDHPATEYVRKHGDGVAIIGIGVNDAGQTYRNLVTRGATSISPPTTYALDDSKVVIAHVSGVGDVTHRLVERHGPPLQFIPGAIEMIERDLHDDSKLLRAIDHIAICVPSGMLSPIGSYYVDVFGFSQIFEEYIEVGGVSTETKVVQSPSQHITFTLTEPDPLSRPGQLNEFLTWHDGAGVQYIAFGTDDIVAAVSTLADRGVRFLDTPPTYYDVLEERVGHLDAPFEDLRRYGVLADRDHWGQLLQIYTEPMHIRRTFFFEIIERRGALTFGSGNLRALHDAKARYIRAERERINREVWGY